MILPVASLADAAVLCDLVFSQADTLLASEVDLSDALQVGGAAAPGGGVRRPGGLHRAELDPEAVGWNGLDSVHARDVAAGVAA